MILAKIRNFKYDKQLRNTLDEINFDDINKIKSNCCINFNGKKFGISKWISPKRTRSYPYSKVYNTFDECNSKTVTVIPIIKDEGYNGDMDYLQWDTISLMSLLGVFVIISYYDSAELNNKNPKKLNKITKQKFNNEHVTSQLTELSKYHQSALHWNINQLSNSNLIRLAEKAKSAYTNISLNLGIKMHPLTNIDKFVKRISNDLDSFMKYSREKAIKAQNREVLTLQPKEAIGVGKKMPITIENYLGGYYFFTVDDVIINHDETQICLIESKHSSKSKIPSTDDIKDGLLKLMLYNNLDEIITTSGNKKKNVFLRLTSSSLICNIKLPATDKEINIFLDRNELFKKEKLIHQLNNEAIHNNFNILIEKA